MALQENNINHKNIKLTIAYDGTNYLGWQKTITGPSIEESLQIVLERILQKAAPLQAASRTDAGVHAVGQVVNFFTEKNSLDLKRLRLALNGLLPKDIVVLSAEEAPHKFHPTLDCSGKTYTYFVGTNEVQFPEHRNFSWHCPHVLNIEAIKEAATHLIGTLDFAALCNELSTRDYTHTIRTVKSINITMFGKGRLRFEITGDHFLYKMARNITGLLIYVGNNKIDAKQVPSILLGRERKEAGITAPAHGLALEQVHYLPIGV